MKEDFILSQLSSPETFKIPTFGVTLLSQDRKDIKKLQFEKFLQVTKNVTRAQQMNRCTQLHSTPDTELLVAVIIAPSRTGETPDAAPSSSLSSPRQKQLTA